jgi:hypothetical protein
MPDLSKLSLDELIQLRAMILTLCEAGKVIALEGAGVTFDLTPGQPALIVTPFEMPQLPKTERAARFVLTHDLWPPKPERKTVAPALAEPPPAVPDADGAAVEPAPAVALTAAGADAPDPEPEPEPEPMAQDVSDLGPAAPPPAAVVEPSPAARATAAGEQANKFAPGAKWSDEDQSRLVQMVAERMHKGQSRAAAAQQVAASFGRPPTAVEQIAKTRLAGRISQALAVLARTPAAPSAKMQGAEPPASPKPNPKVPAELADVARHLLHVTPCGKWTPELDRELIRLSEEAGWPLHEVCLDLDVTSQQAQQRLSVLTKARVFKRAEVWAAMVAVGYGADTEAA